MDSLFLLPLSLLRDIRNEIGKYIEGSRPEYLKAIDLILDILPIKRYLSTPQRLIRKRRKALTEDFLLLFIDHFGDHIGSSLDSDKIYTNIIDMVLPLHDRIAKELFKYPLDEEDSDDDEMEKDFYKIIDILFDLYRPYQSKFIVKLYDKWYYIHDGRANLKANYKEIFIDLLEKKEEEKEKDKPRSRSLDQKNYTNSELKTYDFYYIDPIMYMSFIHAVLSLWFSERGLDRIAQQKIVYLIKDVIDWDKPIQLQEDDETNIELPLDTVLSNIAYFPLDFICEGIEKTQDLDEISIYYNIACPLRGGSYLGHERENLEEYFVDIDDKIIRILEKFKMRGYDITPKDDYDKDSLNKIAKKSPRVYNWLRQNGANLVML